MEAFDRASNVMTLTRNGVTMTLDTEAQRITLSNGYDIELTPQQTADAATAFHSTIVHDHLATLLENAPPPTCHYGEEGCTEEPQFAPPEDLPTDLWAIGSVIPRQGNSIYKSGAPCAIDAKAPAFKTHRLLGHGGELKTGMVTMRVVEKGFPRDPAGRKDQPPRSGVFTASANSGPWPPSCLHIAQAIYSATPAYRSAAAQLRDFIADLPQTYPGLFSFENGRVVGSIPDFVQAGITWEYLLAQREMAALQLNVLASMYAGQGCWTNTWSGWGSSSGGRFELHCRIEAVQISTDGGNTFTTMMANVCEYQ